MKSKKPSKSKTNIKTNIKKINTKLVLLVVILLLIIWFVKFKNKASFRNTFSYIRSNDENENNFKRIDKPLKVKYRKCKYLKLQNTLDTIFKKYKFCRNEENDNDWDLYILCGYNYAETELKNLKITNPDQKVYAIKGCDKIASKNVVINLIFIF